jgi:O-antigen ligase
MSRFNKLSPAPRAATVEPAVALQAPAVSSRFTHSVFLEAKPAAQFVPPAESASAVQNVGFYIVLAYVFARFCLVSEIATYNLGFNPHIIYVVGPLAAFATAFTGGFRRFLLASPAYFLIGFMIWLVGTIPFSTWKGGSFWLIENSFMTDFSMFFMIVGLTLTWRQCVLLMNVIAISGAVDFIATRVYGGDLAGRLIMSFGTLSNPNDLATHLLLAVPFCILLILNSRSMIVRPFAACSAILMLYAIVQTGSRAGLLSVAAVVIYIFFKASPTQKLGLVVTGMVATVLAIAILPSTVLLRYATIFSNDVQVEAGSETDLEYAVTSEEARKQVLMDSVVTTLTHPLFGVGPGNYASADAEKKKETGERAAWAVTHNSYTQVSSESGIPGLILFLGIMLSTFRMVSSVYQRTRRRPELRYLSNTAFMLLITLGGFSVNIFFSALAYTYYLPTLAALSIVFCVIAKEHIRRFENQSAASPVPSASPATVTGVALLSRRSALPI